MYCVSWINTTDITIIITASKLSTIYSHHLGISAWEIMYCVRVGNRHNRGKTWKPGNQTNFSSWNLVESKSKQSEMPKIKMLSQPFHDILCVRSHRSCTIARMMLMKPYQLGEFMAVWISISSEIVLKPCNSLCAGWCVVCARNGVICIRMENTTLLDASRKVVRSFLIFQLALLLSTISPCAYSYRRTCVCVFSKTRW